MKLHTLPKIEGSTHRHKRLGCGRSSGHGKTSGRGHKGMKARSGGGVRPGFEGGQMPLYRKLPHRGFNNVNRVEFAVVNLSQIDKCEGSEIDRNVLVKAGIVRAADLLVKVLGNGEISRPVTVVAQKFSASAKAKIEAAGGKVVELKAETAE
ncbi:MAG TPA: 50S ribosomal protein L15 [Candidatus Spyradosoma merdigallinarum]|uniref:Large ribosomal subunit protein uL15 n=1 Tax=Candidatus Spyradosoma merdigallinarum TaxID=2840950 RepID=A0A9D1NJ89_9BACT|nr:50S ribosomal protein L15 [Candidatus Spyradosoma merdigallinarum]